MPFRVDFYECVDCGKQFDSWSEAEDCEWVHEHRKEQSE